MANASVEKMKDLGLRHGEKIVVTITVVVCLLLVYTGLTRPTIQITPEEVTKSAEQANSNINRTQNEEDILKLLEEADIKEPGFEKMVDTQASKKIDPLAYRIPMPWASPEPGAGLLRETPELIAPTELVVYPGTGGALVFELKDGEKIPITPEEAKAAIPESRLNRRMAMMGMGGEGMPGMGGGMTKKQMDEANKKYELEKKRKAAALAGKDKASDKEEEKAETGPTNYKEITKGLRWVSITGVLDYKTLRENYLTALKLPEVSYPNFKQVDIQRQVLAKDGSWGEWEDVSAEENDEVLDNLPEHDEEWVPEPMRMEALVDPLPFLQAGYWNRVHVASLVPKEKKEVAKPQFNAGGMPGMEGMDMSMSVEPMMPMAGMDTAGMSMGMPEGMMMEGSTGFGGGGDDMSFPHNEEETLMVRALDFTVEPETTYRFRVRIVVFNPNHKREDVAAGVDKEAIELAGPWSEPTEVLTVPADVATYAMQKTASVGATDLVQFEVTKWDNKSGVMVTRRFDAGPGEIIGSVSVVDIPTSDGSGVKRSPIDFTSSQVMFDSMGGSKPIPRDIDNGRFETPALALIVRPDGSVVARNQAYDEPDEVRITIAENYKREKEESDKARESSSFFGEGMEGMMP